jgi:hypothetical protein
LVRPRARIAARGARAVAVGLPAAIYANDLRLLGVTRTAAHAVRGTRLTNGSDGRTVTAGAPCCPVNDDAAVTRIGASDGSVGRSTYGSRSASSGAAPAHTARAAGTRRGGRTGSHDAAVEALNGRPARRAGNPGVRSMSTATAYERIEIRAARTPQAPSTKQQCPSFRKMRRHITRVAQRTGLWARPTVLRDADPLSSKANAQGRGL